MSQPPAGARALGLRCYKAKVTLLASPSAHKLLSVLQPSPVGMLPFRYKLQLGIPDTRLVG
jgi:hypothetical protein